MAKTKFDTPEEKKRLQERALALKPKVPGVIATDQGWAVSRPKGLELLVSFKNLDGLLGDEISEVELVGEPIVVQAEPIVEVPEPVAPELIIEPQPEAEVKEEAKPKAKPGPKKKA